MKKLVSIIALMLLIAGVGICGAGNRYGYVDVNTTGVSVINFPRNTTEIYIVAYSTDTAYVNFVSTTPTTDNFVMGTRNNADVIEHREDVQSGKMSVLVPSGTPDIRIQYKYWAR